MQLARQLSQIGTRLGPWLFGLALTVSLPALAGDEPRSFEEALGSRFEGAHSEHVHRHPKPAAKDVVRRWNRIAIDASGLDHTPVAPGEDRVFGEQLGPGRGGVEAGPLVGVEVQEQALAGPDGVAAGRLELHHVGAEVGHQLGGEAGGHAAVELDDAHVAETVGRAGGRCGRDGRGRHGKRS